jgi:glycosyltransferase involved in cell wall biosynthesis
MRLSGIVAAEETTTVHARQGWQVSIQALQSCTVCLVNPMLIETAADAAHIKVIHCFRSPLGGLFRHVCDLVGGQTALGLDVGLICDATTGDRFADTKLEQLSKSCSLGIVRLPMSRTLSWTDASVMRAARKLCVASKPDIIHGHGAKGGAYGRLLARRLDARAVYTPHGGSLHYSRASLGGMLYLGTERFLQRYTDGLIFECKHSADSYVRKVGAISCPHEVIYNGLLDNEFTSIESGHRSYDFVFVGELRKLKGLDVLLQAVHLLRGRRDVSLLVAGSGSDASYFESRIRSLGLESLVAMSPPIHPARNAFIQAQCVVVPSLAEAFPYIVLEAIGAGVPLITTDVGGIPEIYGRYAHSLLPPNDPQALAEAMYATIEGLPRARRLAGKLHERVSELYKADTMVRATRDSYSRILGRV